jgi:hypothetical protein
MARSGGSGHWQVSLVGADWFRKFCASIGLIYPNCQFGEIFAVEDINNRRFKKKFLLGLIVPILICLIITHFISIGLGIYSNLSKFIVFTFFFTPVFLMWRYRIKKYPDNPAKIDI